MEKQAVVRAEVVKKELLAEGKWLKLLKFHYYDEKRNLRV